MRVHFDMSYSKVLKAMTAWSAYLQKYRLYLKRVSGVSTLQGRRGPGVQPEWPPMMGPPAGMGIGPQQTPMGPMPPVSFHLTLLELLFPTFMITANMGMWRFSHISKLPAALHYNSLSAGTDCLGLSISYLNVEWQIVHDMRFSIVA